MNVEPGHPVSKNYQELIESLKDALTNREGIDSNKSGLTDFNEGSVILTIVHAVARELALIYKQIGVAYDSAFIDEATGIALDNVVALLGVKRRQASKAEGEVTFFRDKMTTKTITIRKNTRVADKRGRVFDTLEDAEIKQGEDKVTVKVIAQKAGVEGNVEAKAIAIMPTPPSGVSRVTNEESLAGGQDEEPDETLRDRAKKELTTRGKGTLEAIEYAVRGVDGVEKVEVMDWTKDNTIALGEVRVRYLGDNRAEVREKVRDVVEKTRAAGILVKIESIDQKILISGTFYVFPDVMVSNTTSQEFRDALIKEIKTLSAEKPLSVRRLNALAYQIKGLAEVVEAQLKHNRGVETGNAIPPINEIKDSFLPEPTEFLKADEANLNVVLLESLKAVLAEDKKYTIYIQLLDQENSAVSFKNVSLDVHIELMAPPIKSSSEALQSINRFTRSIQFTDDKATLVLQESDFSNFQADEHNPKIKVSISARVYPGLEKTEVTINI